MEKYERAVFISYAWGEEGNEREVIVNQIDQALNQRGIKIIRDKRNLGYKGSIRKFMERIGEGDSIIVVISDKYLRSKNCMYELVEISRNKQFADRVFPIILSDAKIYNAGDRVDYVQYWENEKDKLNKKIKELSDISNTQSIQEELNDYDDFRDEIDNLTGILKDMNTLTPDMHRESDFSAIYTGIENRMKGGSSTGPGESPAASYKKALLSQPAFKYGIPAAVGLILLFAFIFNGGNPASETDTPTAPTTPQGSVTPPINVTLPTIATPSELTTIPDITAEPAPATNTPTPTVTSSLPQTFSLSICIYVIDSNANVRNGPGTSYVIMGKIDTSGYECPSFSARIVNVEREVWFQFAHEQQVEFQPFADQWISGSSLAAFDLPRPLPLPICVFNPAGAVSVRILPSVTEEQLGAPLKADGSNCPFFSTRRENSEGIWYQFSSNQRGNEDFQQYAGGWIQEDSLVIRTFSLPVVTLTPIPVVNPTITPSRTPTLVDTDTPVPTETPTP